ncbi:mutator type transposase [Tanacetum coccineum]
MGKAAGIVVEQVGGKIHDMLFQIFKNEEDVFIKHACRIFYATVSLCVPLIINDFIELPFEDVIDYRKIVVLADTDSAMKRGYLSKLLKKVKDDRILEFQRELLKGVTVPVSEEAEVGRTKVLVYEEADNTKEHEAIEASSDEQVDYDVDGITSAYKTQYHVESSEDAGTDDDDEDDDFLVDEENEIAQPAINVHLFCISKDVPFDNIGVTNQVPDDVLEGEDVDVVNSDGFDSVIGGERQKFASAKEAIDRSANPNTTIKIAVEMNIYPSLPTRMFKRIYVCFEALKMGFRAYRRELLGLDGAFMKGTFSGQVLAGVRLYSNNGIYPLAYALVEAESKSSWCWFLECLGDDIDLQLNSNFTFISDRQKFGRALSDLLLNNIREIFNDKIVKNRDKPVITLFEYIMGYCMKRILNVQSVIDECTGPLTSTAIRIMKFIKKDAHLMIVQWKRGGNNAEASSSTCGQAQQEEPVVGQHGFGGSGVGVIIGLFAAGEQPDVGVGSQSSSHTRWTKRRVQTQRLSPQETTPTQPASQPLTHSPVPVI